MNKHQKNRELKYRIKDKGHMTYRLFHTKEAHPRFKNETNVKSDNNKLFFFKKPIKQVSYCHFYLNNRYLMPRHQEKIRKKDKYNLSNYREEQRELEQERFPDICFCKDCYNPSIHLGLPMSPKGLSDDEIYELEIEWEDKYGRYGYQV